jgi:hypothetical protein
LENKKAGIASTPALKTEEGVLRPLASTKILTVCNPDGITAGYSERNYFLVDFLAPFLAVFLVFLAAFFVAMCFSPLPVKL